MTPEVFTALLRHDALFQLLSHARAHPVNRSAIFRGYISSDDPDLFRVAAGLDDAGMAEAENDWHATFKHHLAFILRTDDLRIDTEHAVVADLWSKGVVLFILSAPRSRGGKWRIRLAPVSPITGDCVLVVLSLVGNNYFGHEALRRGKAAPPFVQLTGQGASTGNVLHGLMTEAAIKKYEDENNVLLDHEQRGVLRALSDSQKPLVCVSALAGAGKTALAHCILKAFVEENRGLKPRRLALYTVPTTALREEVVLELVKFKESSLFVALRSDMCLLLVSPSATLNTFKLTLFSWLVLIL